MDPGKGPRVGTGMNPSVEPKIDPEMDHRWTRILSILMTILAAISLAIVAGFLYSWFSCRFPRFVKESLATGSFITSCPPDWVSYWGRCYFFSSSEEDWASSHILCKNHDAEMVTIDTPEEKDFLNHFVCSKNYWYAQGTFWNQSSGIQTKAEVVGKQELCGVIYGLESVQITYDACDNRYFYICQKNGRFET